MKPTWKYHMKVKVSTPSNPLHTYIVVYKYWNPLLLCPLDLVVQNGNQNACIASLQWLIISVLCFRHRRILEPFVLSLYERHAISRYICPSLCLSSSIKVKPGLFLCFFSLSIIVYSHSMQFQLFLHRNILTRAFQIMWFNPVSMKSWCKNDSRCRFGRNGGSCLLVHHHLVECLEDC